MLKKYTAPDCQFFKFHPRDIVATSYDDQIYFESGTGDQTYADPNSSVLGRLRNPIWEDE